MEKTSWSSERMIIEPAYAFVSALSRATRSCGSFTLLMRYSNSPRFWLYRRRSLVRCD